MKVFKQLQVILTCELGRPPVLDLEGQRKKEKAVLPDHCQPDYSFLSVSQNCSQSLVSSLARTAG